MGAGEGDAEVRDLEDRDSEDEHVDEGAIRGPRYVRDVTVPSKTEVDRHNLTHLPYRNWCPHCTRGRGKEAPHRRSEGGIGDIPEISLDFVSPLRKMVVVS